MEEGKVPNGNLGEEEYEICISLVGKILRNKGT
jgi:hypothetical protein